MTIQKSHIYFYNSLLITNIHSIKNNNIIKYNLSDSYVFLLSSILSLFYAPLLFLFLLKLSYTALYSYLYSFALSQDLGNWKS